MWLGDGFVSLDEFLVVFSSPTIKTWLAAQDRPKPQCCTRSAQKVVSTLPRCSAKDVTCITAANTKCLDDMQDNICHVPFPAQRSFMCRRELPSIRKLRISNKCKFMEIAL